jgi:hypothetical protein
VLYIFHHFDLVQPDLRSLSSLLCHCRSTTLSFLLACAVWEPSRLVIPVARFFISLAALLDQSTSTRLAQVRVPLPGSRSGFQSQSAGLVFLGAVAESEGYRVLSSRWACAGSCFDSRFCRRHLIFFVKSSAPRSARRDVFFPVSALRFIHPCWISLCTPHVLVSRS